MREAQGALLAGLVALFRQSQTTTVSQQLLLDDKQGDRLGAVHNAAEHWDFWNQGAFEANNVASV